MTRRPDRHPGSRRSPSVALAAVFLLSVACSGTARVEPTPTSRSAPPASPSPAGATGSNGSSTLVGRIVFSAGARGEEDVYVVNADGSDLARLTDDPAADYDPSWSPDCTRIAFRSDRDGDSEIYVMNADGSEPVNLTRNPAEDLSPAWAPDGSAIAFASSRVGGLSTIWAMAPDGTDQRRIGEVDGEYMAWSPDGAMFAFDVQTFSEDDFDVWVMNTDGSRARLLIGGPGSDQGPAWSPDGTRLAYQSERGSQSGPSAIWIAGSDGRDAVIASDEGYRPDWSPDGRFIVFMRAGGLYVTRANAAGAETRVPIEGVAAEIAFPDWSCS